MSNGFEISRKERKDALKELITLGILEKVPDKQDTYRYLPEYKKRLKEIIDVCWAFIATAVRLNFLEVADETFTPDTCRYAIAQTIGVRFLSEKLGYDYVHQCLSTNDRKVNVLITVLAETILFVSGW